ncbi:MAG TPA: hypothetical protein VKA31_10045 [Mariprofundaceae bacterium]|nr:hypothetical protein [Mariprofundaceae bacterium]
MNLKQFRYLFIVSAFVAACCSEEFDLSSEGQGSMAGATPTASEVNIACQRAKAKILEKCEQICAENAKSTDPDVKGFIIGNMTVYGECQTVPHNNVNVVKAFMGGKCKCCN